MRNAQLVTGEINAREIWETLLPQKSKTIHHVLTRYTVISVDIQ